MSKLRRMREGALEGWSSWRGSSWRRAFNEQAAASDRLGFLFMAVLFPVLLISKTWLREGLPVLALKASTHAMLAGALAALGMSNMGRQLYTSCRELLLLLYSLHMQWTVRLTALYGAVNTIDHHGGSTLKLFFLLGGHTTALYTALYALYGRTLWPASGLMLAATAATSLASGERMCMRVLESPGVEAPLADLHSLLGGIHWLTMSPTAAALLSNPPLPPMQQCLVINAWLSVVLGTLLPCLLLRRMERRARRLHAARQRQQQPPQQAQQQQEAGPARPAALATQESGGWAELFLASSAVWAAASALTSAYPACRQA